MTRKTTLAALAALTIAGAVLRGYALDSGLWYDEIVTLVQSVRPPLGHILFAFPGANDHPLYSVLAHVSTSLFGEANWTLRLPAAIFGVAAIPMIYAVGVMAAPPIEALLAAALVTFSYHAVWFSQNARGYTALLFWTLVATFFFLRLLRAPTRRIAVWYGLSVAAGCYTHLTMAPVAGAHALIALWHVVMLRNAGERTEATRAIRTAAYALTIAGIVTFVLYAPLLAQVSSFFAKPHHDALVVATPRWAVLEALKGLRIGFGGVGVALVGILALAGLWSYWRRTPAVALAYTLPLPVSAALLVVMHSPLRPRFAFNLLGFAALFAVRGAFELAEAAAAASILRRSAVRTAGAVVALSLIVVSALSLPAAYARPKQDFDGAGAFVDAHQAAGEPVATAGLARYPFSDYFAKPWNPVERLGELERLEASATRVWVVYSFLEYVDADLASTLRKDCVPRQVLTGTLSGGDVVVCTIDRGFAQ